MKLSLEQRVTKLEKLFKQQEKSKSKRALQIAVMKLDWKHHGWAGNPDDLEENREEWRQTQEIIDLVKNSETK